MGGLAREQVKSTAETYRELHEGSLQGRRDSYAELVNQYYDLVTDFYEFGWGTSFHFATRRHGESMKVAIARHEHYLCDALGLREGMSAVDIGCGVGGPMREIARRSGATVVGINNNAYQVERGWKHTRNARLSEQCTFVKADFMQLPHRDAAFDAAYTIEASCHAPDRVALFREISRVLKPGASFAGYEWCLTNRFDLENQRHLKIKKDIEEGNGLPDIAFTWQVDAWLVEAGFELVTAQDLAPESPVPWYESLTGRDLSVRSLPRTPLGRKLTNGATRLMEKLHLAPPGTTEVSDFLNAGADALVAGGESQIFTPMYFFSARKPAHNPSSS